MRTLPRGVFLKGRKLYIKVLQDGTWTGITSGYTLAEDPHGHAAARLRTKVQAQLDAGLAGPGPTTVKRYVKRWLETRKTRHLVSYVDDVSRINTHVLPTLGPMTLTEVKPRHIRAWVFALRQAGLAPRTIRNIYAVTATMFKDAVIDEVIDHSPCLLRRGDLPTIADADPEWRETAIFTKAEVEQLIGDDRIPWDRRVCYALMCLGGFRFSEMAALRWRHWNTELQPLGRLSVGAAYSHKLKREKQTKTGITRKVPVHPVLATMLARWKLEGWARYWKRPPGPDDLIVPSRQLTDEGELRNRNVNAAKNAFNADLEVRLKWKRRRQHDARRTLRSLLADAGGSERAIEWIVWGRPVNVAGRYDEPAWEALSNPVLAVDIRPRGSVGSVENASQHETTSAPDAEQLTTRNPVTRKREK